MNKSFPGRQSRKGQLSEDRVYRSQRMTAQAVASLMWPEPIEKGRWGQGPFFIVKGQFIKGWSKTNAEHKEGAETTLGWKDEEAGHSCSQRRVILHKEAGRIKTSSLILLNILEARGHKKPIDTVTPPGQRPE